MWKGPEAKDFKLVLNTEEHIEFFSHAACDLKLMPNPCEVLSLGAICRNTFSVTGVRSILQRVYPL